MVLEDVLHAHPISEQRMKEVLGHTPLQVRAQPAADAWGASKTRRGSSSLCAHGHGGCEGDCAACSSCMRA